MTVGRETSARRDRDSLLLAAGELGGPVLQPVGEPDLADQIVDERLLGLPPDSSVRQQDVLLGRQHREQVEELEDEADVLPAELRQVVVAEVRDLGAVDRDRA